MWHLWAHIGSDGRTILGPELRADAIAYGFAELCADAVAYVFADPRADVAPELSADESPDLSADEQADGSSVARADDAADVGAVACAHDGAHAEAVARADPVVDADHDADHGADEGPDDHPDDRADVAAVGSAVARAVEGPDGRSDGAGPDTCADEGPDERADGSTHPRAVAEADQHALPDAAAVARAEHTSADARALGVPDARAHAAPGGGTRGRRRRQERSPRPRRVRRSMESRNGGYHNDGYHYRDDCERCAGTVRIRTDDRFRGRDDAPLLHYAKSMLHRDQDLCVEKDGPRRLAAQGLPQVLRGGIGKGQTGAEARTRPDVLLQEKVEPFLPVS